MRRCCGGVGVRMATKPRLSTNVINGLEEAQAVILSTWPSLRRACRVARERYQDPALLGDLALLATGLADVEFHVRNARAGRFVERR